MHIEYLHENMPVLYEFWPFILTGGVCLISAIFLVKSALKVPADICLSSGPDLLDKVDMLCTSDHYRPDLLPSLPEDLKHVRFNFQKLPLELSVERSKEFFELMNQRRTIRFFSPDPVPKEIIRNIILTAGTGPSGVFTEPWTYVVVSDLDLKKKIRTIVEAEEKLNYERRMGAQWVADLKPLRTNWKKEYLTIAPYLILVFKQLYVIEESGKRRTHYYREMSIAIAAGILLTAIHYAGLVSLISTPLNCGPSIRSLLKRPKNEKLALLVPVGYPAGDATVPDLKRKRLDDILVEL